MQADRRMYRKTNVQIYIHVHTYRNKDVHRRTDRQTVQKCRKAGRQTDSRQMYRKTTAYIKADRQTEHTSKEQTSTERQADRQIE
jgi:hypothetical protein